MLMPFGINLMMSAGMHRENRSLLGGARNYGVRIAEMVSAEIMISAGIHRENRSLPGGAPKCCSESGKVERSVNYGV